MKKKLIEIIIMVVSILILLTIGNVIIQDTINIKKIEKIKLYNIQYDLKSQRDKIEELEMLSEKKDEILVNSIKDLYSKYLREEQLILSVIESTVEADKLIYNEVKENKIVNNILIERTKRPSYEYLKSVTVFIKGVALNVEGNLEGWRGTGSIIKIDDKYTYILTNKHVAKALNLNTILSVEDEEKDKYARLVDFHNVLDLAIIRINGKLKGKQAIKGFNKAKQQDPVFIAGHHLGRKYIYGEGVFAGYDDEFVLIQMPVLYGNSGSGVFNQQGELVAVIFAISVVDVFYTDVAHGLCIDSEDVIEFVNKVLK